MTIRPLAVSEEVRKIPIATFESSAPMLERAIPLGSHSSPRHEGLTELELDSYQVALVPLPILAGGSAPQYGAMAQLLFLPFTWNELIAQVRREMGRSSFAKESGVMKFGQVRIDLLAMEVRRSDRPVSLTAMEFKVLKFFVSNPNRVISRDELLNQVWGYDNYPCTRTVDNHVLRLRQKLEAEMAHPVHFRTVHGIGYKFIP